MASNVSVQNDPVLTNIYLGYMPGDQEFIRTQILPLMPVSESKADLVTLGTLANQALQIHAKVLIGSTGTPEIEVTITKQDGYETRENGLKIRLTKQIAKNFNKSDWQAGMDKGVRMFTKMLKTAYLTAKEYALMSQIFTATNYDASNKVTLSGTDQFNDYAASDPISVINDAFNAINDDIGRLPNIAVMNLATFLVMRHHPQLKRTAGIAPTGTVPVRALNRAELATAIGVDRIAVGNVMYETAGKGLTSSKSQIWGKKLLLAYVNPSPQPEQFETSMGYTFQLDPEVVDIYSPEDPKHIKFVRVYEDFVDTILSFDAGFLVSDVIA